MVGLCTLKRNNESECSLYLILCFLPGRSLRLVSSGFRSVSKVDYIEKGEWASVRSERERERERFTYLGSSW